MVDNFEAAVAAVGDRLHHLGFGHAFAQAQIAKQQPEKEEGTGDRKQGQYALHDKLASAGGYERKQGEAAAGADAEEQGAGRPWQARPAKPRRGLPRIVARLDSCHGGKS